MAQRYLALDLGASTGRGIVGAWDGRRLSLEEVCRFENPSVTLGGHLYWDTLAQWRGIRSAMAAAGEGIAAVGVDTWGVDFGLIGADGTLLGSALHYRNTLPEAAYQAVEDILPERDLYARVGIAKLAFNTLYQLSALRQRRSSALDAARWMLPVADLFGYFMTGEVAAEATMASTTQMVDLATGDWARDLIERLGIPAGILPPIQPPGSRRGAVRGDILPGTPYVAVGCHDTASAVAAVPAKGRFAYCSSGTWSLLGTELPAPRPTEEARAALFTNELGVGGRTRLLKNVMGLWIIQECRRTWNAAGASWSYADIAEAAAAEEPCAALIDPDDAIFLPPGDMPARIAEYCARTRQAPPRTPACVARAVFDSLALKYRWSLERLRSIAQTPFDALHIVGGGAQNPLLNQLTADALEIPVYAGPVEATAIGNILVQAMALGEIGSIGELREAVSRSFPAEAYHPARGSRLIDAYEGFCRLVGEAGA